MYQKRYDSQINGMSKNTAQEDDDGRHRIENDQCPELSIDEGFLACLPKTFKSLHFPSKAGT